jgi:hypothetical protein
VDDALEAEVTAFVTSFMSAYDKAAVTGEFDAVEKLIAPSCGGCKQNLMFLKDIYEGGGRIEGGAYTNPRFRVIGGSAKSVSVRVESTIAAYKVFKKSGTVAESEPAKADLSIFIVGRSASGSWQVTSWS